MLSRSLQHQTNAKALQVGRRSLLIGGSILGLCADYATAVVFAVTYAGGNALPMAGSIASVVLVRCLASMKMGSLLPCARPLQRAPSLLAMLFLLSLGSEGQSNPLHTLTGQQLTQTCVKVSFSSSFCDAVQICLYGISFGFSWGPIGGCLSPLRHIQTPCLLAQKTILRMTDSFAVVCMFVCCLEDGERAAHRHCFQTRL